MGDDRAEPPEGPPDGPWWIGATCRLCVRSTGSGSVGDDPTEIAARWRDAGVPLSGVERAADLVAQIDHARRTGTDLILVADGVDLHPGTALELRRVAASDPMIAGVSPRVLNGSNRPDARGRAVLPRVSYVPLPEQRCLYLKASVLSEFQDAPTDGDWDAYAMRVGDVGFRMAVANHALIEAPATPADLPARAKRLEPRFPGSRAAIDAFLTSTPVEAAHLLGALEPDASGRRRVCFDLTHIGANRSGTGEAALALIRRAAAWTADWTVCVLASPETHAFHFGGSSTAPGRIDPSAPEPCAVFVRIGQPFGWKEVDTALRRAPVLVVFMLDTIGLDCIRLAPDDLDALWRFTLSEADGLLFNSAFTERQYARRFGLQPDQPRRASLHSLDTSDYAGSRQAVPTADTILVIGNGFPHKRVAETATLLASAFPGRPIAALGLASGAVPGVDGHPSGALDDDDRARLYAGAALVVYPSLYEGFGLPLLEALAHRKPVLVRALPPFEEIAREVPGAANIHRFQTDEDLLDLVRAAPPWVEGDRDDTVRSWEDALADLREVVEAAVERVDYDRVLRRIDFLRGRMAFLRQKPFMAEAASAEDVDRLAALAGRLARGAILKAASLPGLGGVIRRVLSLARQRAAR